MNGDYAQTNIQLYNQLRSAGYSDDEVARIHQSYEVAMDLFTGVFSPSGKPFLNHLVGTASVLCSLRARAALIASALLHAAYIHGDFGTPEKGMTDVNREYLRKNVGEEIEEIVFRYTNLKWNPKLIPQIYASIDTLTEIDREVVLMRVSNQFESLLDHGILYRHDSQLRRQSLERSSAGLIQIANKLGAPFLAAELGRITETTLSIQIPVEMLSTRIKKKAFLHKPFSDREKE
ncbi:hypothetical protein L0156_08355 [bacterium]|nr:hypothetical protein [bacterium]